MNKKNLIVTTLIAILVGAAAFFAGVKYQQSQKPRFQNTSRTMNFRPVNGEIISVDEKSITVKLADSSSKIVLLSGKTEINKAASVSATELKTGEKISVVGQENTDGSITAQSIRLNLLK